MKKRTATKLVRKALGFIEYEIGTNAIKHMYEVIDNVTLFLFIYTCMRAYIYIYRLIKVSEVWYLIPSMWLHTKGRGERGKLGLAIRWIVF
ncbi:MAG: hypothetical protein ACTS5A_02060 [Candidatus Hodgkinia cicadicola]